MKPSRTALRYVTISATIAIVASVGILSAVRRLPREETVSGNTGVSTGPHLDFGLYRGGTSIDPLTMLPRGK